MTDNRILITRPVLSARVTGESACFSRPEHPTERISYPIITPTAAVGVLESVFWKPQMRWIPLEVRTFLAPEFQNIRINGRKAGDREGRAANTQLNFRVLGPVDYEIDYGIEVTDPEGHLWNVYVDQARRRLEKGQFFRTPFLGSREHLANLELAESPRRRAPDLSFPVGPMVHTIDYTKKALRPSLFHAHVDHGVMQIPLEAEWRAA